VLHPDLCASGATAAVSRRDKFRLATVAMVGASAIAVTPLTQGAVELQQAQTRAYDLTASMVASDSPVEVYGQFFSNTFSNLQLLGSAIAADPAPILSQILENQQGYANEFGAAFEAIPASLETWWAGSNGKARLMMAQASLEAGDFDQAYRWFNHSLLYAFSAAFGPLIAPGLILSGIPRGSTEYLAGMPEQMSQNFTNVVANVFTSFVLTTTLFQGSIGIFSGAAFELSRTVETIAGSAASGDVPGIVNALVNTPALLANAMLNGFDYGDVDDPNTPGNDNQTEWPALLTFADPGEQGGLRIVAGVLQQLLINLPKRIADAIDNSPVVVPPVVTPPVVTPPVTTPTVQLVTVDVPAPSATTEQTVEAPKAEAAAAAVEDDDTTEAAEAKATEAAEAADAEAADEAAEAKATEAAEAAEAAETKAAEAAEAAETKAAEAADAKDAVKSTDAGESNESTATDNSSSDSE
jgi:hypothetical protein